MSHNHASESVLPRLSKRQRLSVMILAGSPQDGPGEIVRSRQDSTSPGFSPRNVDIDDLSTIDDVPTISSRMRPDAASTINMASTIRRSIDDRSRNLRQGFGRNGRNRRRYRRYRRFRRRFALTRTGHWSLTEYRALAHPSPLPLNPFPTPRPYMAVRIGACS